MMAVNWMPRLHKQI
jgi:hypothetical protein